MIKLVTTAADKIDLNEYDCDTKILSNAIFLDITPREDILKKLFFNRYVDKVFILIEFDGYINRWEEYI